MNIQTIKLAEALEALKLDDDYQELRLDKLSPLDLSDVDSNEDREVKAHLQDVTCPQCGNQFEV